VQSQLLSGNVPSNLGGGSNEIRIIDADLRDSFLWEDPNAPIYIRAEQPNAASLRVLYVALLVLRVRCRQTVPGVGSRWPVPVRHWF
jgi:hypothetical protein